MTGEADTPRGAAGGAAPQPAVPGAGHDPGAGRDSRSAAAVLLLVCEPAGAPDAPDASVLMAEGTRIAGMLGWDVHPVSWEVSPDVYPELPAAAVAAAARRTRPGAILLADTDMGRRLAPVVAHRLGSGAVVGCSDVRARAAAAPVFVKPVYGGWLEQEIEPAAGTIPVITLDISGLSAAGPGSGEPRFEVLALEGPAGAGPVRRLELVPPDPRTVDLVHAKRIVAAGAGSAGEHLLAAVQELADLLDGSVGATRPVVDDGLLPKERLIGQTGRTVSPELYLALGISGSPHHVAGVRDADRVLSVNRDTRAPIFQFSDIGYVADLEVVLPRLVRRIKEFRDACG